MCAMSSGGPVGRLRDARKKVASREAPVAARPRGWACREAGRSRRLCVEACWQGAQIGPQWADACWQGAERGGGRRGLAGKAECGDRARRRLASMGRAVGSLCGVLAGKGWEVGRRCGALAAMGLETRQRRTRLGGKSTEVRRRCARAATRLALSRFDSPWLLRQCRSRASDVATQYRSHVRAHRVRGRLCPRCGVARIATLRPDRAAGAPVGVGSRTGALAGITVVSRRRRTARVDPTADRFLRRRLPERGYRWRPPPLSAGALRRGCGGIRARNTRWQRSRVAELVAARPLLSCEDLSASRASP